MRALGLEPLDRRVERRRVGARDVQRRAEPRDLLDARLVLQPRLQRRQVGPLDPPGRRARPASGSRADGPSISFLP